MISPNTSYLTAELQARLDAISEYPSAAVTNSTKLSPAVRIDDESARRYTKSTDDSTKSAYCDYSHVRPEDHNQTSALLIQTTSAKEPTFPVKLHMILSNPEYQDIVSWLPHGRSWRILQQKAFEERVIPLYFRHGRYSSFARQVNGWGFRRITHGSDYNSYYHELFLRGMPYLCDKMRRLTSKGISKRKKTEEEPTPDFYALSRENPLPETTSPQIASTRPPTRAPSPPAAPTIPAPGTQGFAEMELAILERRRAEILDRMNCLSASKGFQTNAVRASLPSALLGVGPLLNANSASFQSQIFGATYGANAEIAKLLGLQQLGGLPRALMGAHPYGL